MIRMYVFVRTALPALGLVEGSASPDDWCPFADADLKEKHRPKLTEGFWKTYAPKRGCSVVSEPNEPIQENSY